MGFWAYWSGIVRVAFRHSVDATQGVLFALFIAAGVLSKAVPSLASASAAVNRWQTAASVLVAIFVVRLALAAYWRDAEARRNIRAFERRVRELEEGPASALAIWLTPSVGIYWDRNNIASDGTVLPGPVMLGYGMTVRNRADTPLRECQMRVRYTGADMSQLARSQTPFEPASAPFVLRPREDVNLPTFGIQNDYEEPMIERTFFHQSSDGWRKSVNTPWLTHGSYIMDIEVHSMDTIPVAISFDLVPQEEVPGFKITPR
jgi:hypothetical protein